MYVPGFTVDLAKKNLKAMQDLYHECDVKKGEDDPAPLSNDLPAAGELCKKTTTPSKNVLEVIAMIASQKG